MAATISSPLETPVAVSATKLLINGQWTNSESGKTFRDDQSGDRQGNLSGVRG